MTNHLLSLSYWKITKNIYYSILFIFPMLFLYEVMCFIQFSDTSAEIRNGADVFLRQLIMGLEHGRYSELIYGFILFIIFLVIMCINRNVVREGRLKFKFLLYMVIESLIWSFGFIILMSISDNLILLIFERNIIPEQFYLAIGAGIWEELLFRVCAIGLSLSFMAKFVGYSSIYSAFIAILFYVSPLCNVFAIISNCLRSSNLSCPG